MLSTRTRTWGKRALWRTFLLGQRSGVDVLPRHFYSEVPDVRRLQRTQSWRRPMSMVGVLGSDLQEQRTVLESWFPAPVGRQLTGRDVHAEACRANGSAGYGPVEAEVLYAFCASQRPALVVQVGAGVSTAVVLAAKADFGLATRVVCVDPYPTALLRRLHEAGEIELVEEPAQDVALEVLTSLSAGDLLFVDSTHTVVPGGEVPRLVLEVLPRLAPGVFVHFHDITFPYGYQRDLLDGALFFWNESVLLHALLVDNPRLTLRVSTSMLHDALPAAISRCVPRYRRQPGECGLREGEGDFPSATYVQVVR